MISFDDIELNGLKFNDCIDIELKNVDYGFNRFFFNGFKTCDIMTKGKSKKMIVHVVITPTKTVEGIYTKPITVDIDKISSIIINDN